MKIKFVVVVGASLLSLQSFGQYMRVAPNFAVDIDGPLYAIDLQADGKILIGGAFTNVNGSPRTNLARLHVDGAIDESFAVKGATLTDYVFNILVTSSNIYAAASDNVGKRRFSFDGTQERTYYAGHAFAVDAERRLVFGAMTHWQRWDRVRRFNEDGSKDTNFFTIVDSCCLSHGVNAVAMQKNAGGERILLGGNFGEVNGYETWGLARLNDDGSTDTSFIGNAPGPIVAIDVLKGGMFYAATRLSVARYFADSTRDPEFTILEFSDNDYYRGITADERGGVIAWGSYCPVACGPLIRRFNGDGTLDTNFAIHVNGPGPIHGIAAQSDGSILIAGQFTTVNCIPRPSLARLIPSDTPDSLPCIPPPPKPEPQLTVTRKRGAKMACCWPTNYSEYTLQATRRLRRNHPEKEKWVTVTNTPVVGDSNVCVTNKIARYGRHYRLVKP